VPTDHDDLPLAADAAAPTAAEFDRAFSAAAASPGVRRVWELTAPELPPQIEPFSFVSADLQDLARQRLPVANLVHRVAVAATAPDR